MDRKKLLERLKQAPKRVSIAVPEIDPDTRFYFTPLTPADEIAIAEMQEGLETGPANSDVYRGVAAVVVKLQFEDGSPVFYAGDIPLLMNQNSAFIGRLVREINVGEGDYPEMVEAEKKPSPVTGAE